MEFVTLYIQDALADRVWVDDELNQLFVENILTAFPALPNPNPSKDEKEQQQQHKQFGGALKTSRYDDINVKETVMRAISSNFERPSTIYENTKSLIRTMTTASWFPNVRIRASSQIEGIIVIVIVIIIVGAGRKFENCF